MRRGREDLIQRSALVRLDVRERDVPERRHRGDALDGLAHRFEQHARAGMEQKRLGIMSFARRTTCLLLRRISSVNTSRSVSRTDRLPYTTRAAVAVCCAVGSASIARAWPISITPLSRYSCAGFASEVSRNRLVTALRERPTALAAASCVRPNSSISRVRPIASSSGFRSSRWMFSIKRARAPTGPARS